MTPSLPTPALSTFLLFPLDFAKPPAISSSSFAVQPSPSDSGFRLRVRPVLFTSSGCGRISLTVLVSSISLHSSIFSERPDPLLKSDICRNRRGESSGAGERGSSKLTVLRTTPQAGPTHSVYRYGLLDVTYAGQKGGMQGLSKRSRATTSTDPDRST